MAGKRQWHMRSRILAMFLGLTLIVFLCIFLAFNLFLQGYIRSDVEGQLEALMAAAQERLQAPGNRRMEGADDSPLPNLSGQPSNKLGTRGEAFILAPDYLLLDYQLGEDCDELTRIAKRLEASGLPVGDVRSLHVNTGERDYYISAIADPLRPDAYMVFYVDVTAIMGLAGTINIALAVIMAAAMALSFVIAGRIAESFIAHVKTLSDFAADIGGGNFETRALTFRDMEFQQLAGAMNQAAEKLDAYDRDQRAFFQNVSHELRTPLMSIRCYAEGIACGMMDPKESSGTILAETDRLSSLVDDLLYLSRMDSASTLPGMEEHDLRETLSLCASRLRSIGEKNNIVFRFQFDEEPVLFTCQENHMQRAFGNLISNALRYAGSSVTLTCRRTAAGIEVSVADDGPGIEDEDLPHIFERFYKGKGGKYGIGLSIVKSVVELHGGEISVIQEETTCFQVTFLQK